MLLLFVLQGGKVYTRSYLEECFEESSLEYLF